MTTVSRPLSGNADLFQEILEQVSLPVLVPMMSAKSRWFLVVEIFLGHASIRGGRSRDFPFSSQRRRNADLCHQLIDIRYRFRPGKSKLNTGEHSAYTLVLSLLLIETSNCSIESELDAERHFTTALYVLLESFFSDTELPGLWNLLGISLEGNELSSAKKKEYLRQTWLFAKELATVASTHIPPAHRAEPQPLLTTLYDLRPNTIECLKNNTACFLYLKSRKIQTYLDKCLRPFIQRGASYWCSQITSRIRDIILEQLSDSYSLFIDNDAVTVFIGKHSVCLAALEATIRQRLFSASGDEISSSFISQHYPRLTPYLQAAINESLTTSSVIPEFSIELRENISLFQIASECLFIASESQENTQILTIKNTDMKPLLGDPCYGRRGDTRINHPSYSVPLWYNPSGNQAYGWASIVFSLAGMAYNRMTNESVRELLRKEFNLSVLPVKTQKELLSNISIPCDKLCYVKFDGDKVGQLFTSRPILQRPTLSIQLEDLMRSAWVESLAEMIKKFSLSIVPADLLYFGGDDLLAIIPEALCSDFLNFYDESLLKLSGTTCQVNFTYAVISYELYSETNTSAEEDMSSHQLINQVNKKLELAKQLNRSQSKSEALTRHTMIAGLRD
jgi:hypothetical protein